MRAILLALLVLGSVALVAPTTALAHTGECPWGDWNCWLKCKVHETADPLGDHGCRWVFHPDP